MSKQFVKDYYLSLDLWLKEEITDEEFIARQIVAMDGREWDKLTDEERDEALEVATKELAE